MARANLAALIDPYRSETEREWAEGNGMLYVSLEFDGARVLRMDYEPETFNLPGGSYTPDFRCILETGQVIFVEIKGSKKQKGYRDARSKLRAAAELNPMYTFVVAVGGKDGFELEVIDG